uniref:phosphatidylinositol 3-kinase n=1 Tax=Daphnia galeata TaxID=27404 RepID=A0A8J2RBD9_9CRUS|nr:unnamed protein product [Daphnia galeata]
MSPASPYNIWENNPPQDAKILISCLMPNSIIIPLDVMANALLSELKEELWEEVRKYPLQGLLKEQSSYNLMCINCMAERETLIDESRRLCDVKPFQNLLKVVEREGDKAEETLNTKIGQLIGKGLHDFDSLKSLEVNEFRWRMKDMVSVISRETEDISTIDKIKQQYPCDMAESDDLPTYLAPKLRDGIMQVNIQLENTETCFSFSIAHTATPCQLTTMALQRNAHLLGQYPIDEDIGCGHVLKVSGRQEYLIGDFPLSRFLYVRNTLTREGNPSFVVVASQNVVLERVSNTSSATSNAQDADVVKRNSRNSFPTLRKKQSLLSWKVDSQFSFRVESVSLLNTSESEVGIQAGIFHGGRSLCEPRKTQAKSYVNGECTWNEELIFDLKVRDLPRAARLCLVVYSLSKMSKGAKGSRRTFKDLENEMYINQLAWANTTIFDYEGLLKTGSFTLYMWTYAEDVQNEEIMNPLGTVVSNPNVDHATALTLAFTKFQDTKLVQYPKMEDICAAAANFRDESDDSGMSSLSSLSGDTSSLSSFSIASTASINSLNSINSVNSMASTSSLTCKRNNGSAMFYITEQLRYTAERDPLHEMHEDERRFLWSLRYQISQQVPNLLPKLLLCIEWNDYKETAEMLSLLPNWPKLPPARALELLDFAYADAGVRSFAIECVRQVSDDELLLYLLQLVQALKHESYLECDLVNFLIVRALRNRKIGHFLFWHLRAEMHVPAVAVRFGLMLEAYCRGAPDHMKIFSRQLAALNRLQETSEMARQKKEGRDKLKQLVQESLKQNHFYEALSDLLCPLDPALRCRRIRVEKCKTMDSKMRPLWAVFENDDPSGNDIYFIFKHGDDLRQDMLTLQMIRIMDRLWKQAGLDLRMNPYGCISTGNRVGLIEVVLDADTIANIQKEKGVTKVTATFERGSLLAWLKDHNPTETALNNAIEQFSLSCAGYCVATYVLGIADRHSDNIMVKKNGQLFHIDFGHILGHFKEKFGIRRERVPFVLTHDFEHVITKGQTKKGSGPVRFEAFQSNCEQAFLVLRRHGSFIISLLAMMISTGLPELSCEKDLNYLRETMVLDLSEQEALRHFRSQFEEAKKNSWKTSINWTIHNLASDNRQ